MGLLLWVIALCSCIVCVTLAIGRKREYKARISACGYPPRPVPYHLPFGKLLEYVFPNSKEAAQIH